VYTVTQNEQKAILKVSAQEGQSVAVNKTSVESAAQEDDFHEVKRCKRHIFNFKMPPKAMLTHNFFTSLRTADMDMETTEAEKTLQEQEAPRKPGRPLPIVMTFTMDLIGLQSDLQDHVRGEYKSQNTKNGAQIVTKEVVNYPAMKSYLEKNNLHYFTLSPNSEKPIKAVIHRLTSGMPVEDISNSLEDLGINVRLWRPLKQHPMDKPMWNPFLYSLLL
jgi:hypothetical protein